MRKISKTEPIMPAIAAKKKIAAYARISMESERMHHSLSAQISYYNALIQKKPEWEFAGVYADDGISGTGIAKRTEFLRMIADCEAGKIDIILTKSIQRFARNTVDLLETVRHLKDISVEVIFEKENITSMSGDGELMLSILASFAQEESRSISENVKWGTRKRFEQGIPNGRFQIYGYRREGNHLVVEPEEAKIVKMIFDDFLNGLSAESTEKKLEQMGVKSYKGQHFSNTSIRQILSNVTYTGNLLFQKEYVSDPITGKSKINRGDLPQYYVENNHEAIIDPQIFELVQAEIAKRNKGKERYSGVRIFSTKVQCAECGGWYGSKVWHSNDKYRRIIYQCNNKFRNKTGCSTPHLTEYEIKEYFIKALNRLITEKDEIIANTEMIQKMLCDNSELKAKRDALQEEIAVTVELTQNAVAENARVAQDQDDYNKRYNALVERYDRLKAQYDEVSTAISDNEARYEQMGRFITALKDQEGVITEFDDALWSSLVEKIVVKSKEDVTVVFKDGTEMKAE